MLSRQTPAKPRSATGPKGQPARRPSVRTQRHPRPERPKWRSFGGGNGGPLRPGRARLRNCRATFGRPRCRIPGRSPRSSGSAGAARRGSPGCTARLRPPRQPSRGRCSPGHVAGRPRSSAPAPLPLDLVQRDVRPRRDRQRLIPGLGAGDADRCPDPSHPRHLRLDAVPEPRSERREIATRQEHRELVTAEAIHAVIGTDTRAKGRGDRLERLVAGRMAVRVIHDLEAIDVHHREEQAAGQPPVAERGR